MPRMHDAWLCPIQANISAHWYQTQDPVLLCCPATSTITKLANVRASGMEVAEETKTTL